MSKILFISFLLLSVASIAQQAYPSDEKGLLWEVTSDNSNHKSYLFGTIHMIDPDKFLFPKKIEKLIKKADTVVLELADLNETEILASAKLKAGSVFDFLNEEQEDSLFNFVKQKVSIIDSASFRTLITPMRPIFVSQILGQLKGTVATESYELTIFELIKDHHLNAIGFESVAEQFDLFDQLDSTDQARMIMEVISGQSNDLLVDLEDVYLQQNIDQIYDFLQESEDWSRNYNELLIINRNKNWANQLKDKLQTGNYFIAVGSGHLGGPEGLVRLLQLEGYHLQPIILE